MNRADNMTPWTRFAMSVAVGCIAALGGCTEARLQKQTPQVLASLDDNLRIKGRFCTERSGEVIFPVKVLFLLDQSSSLQCMDSGQKRFDALNKSINSLRANPNTEFAFVGFSSWSRHVDFTRNRDDIAEFMDPNRGLGPATDYQGALATAIRVLESDMLEAGPAVRARTRYQVVFVSDGVPGPVCHAGCEDDKNTCNDGIDNDGDGLIDAEDPSCALDENNHYLDDFRGPCNVMDIPDDTYVDMTGTCPDYNQPRQIYQRVDELIALKDHYSVGGLVMNTVLLFSPQEVVQAVCPEAAEEFGFERVPAEILLRQMALQGGGTFRDADTAVEDDNFLQFDITSLKAEQVLTSMMATNINARRGPNGELEVDSDGDGLSDRLERELNSDPHKWDTDGDGYGDLFEYIHRAEGFSLTDPNKPAIPCDDRDDRDGDGLNGCEEAYLGTNPLLPDTDGDGIWDWYEMLHSTDPLVSDAHGDLDFDGITNITEIYGGTQPNVPDAEIYRDSHIIYGLEDRGLMQVERADSTPEDPKFDERHCYDYDIRRIPLVVTPIPRQHGRNRVLIHTDERPARVGGVTGETRVACFEAFYDGAKFKNPTTGVIDTSIEAFEGVRERLATAFEGLDSCGYFDPDDALTRGAITEMVETCMPPKIALQTRLYPQSELIDLVESTVSGDLSPKIPHHPHALFVPIQNFSPDRDCHRPWEFDLLEDFIDKIEAACQTCANPQSTTPEDP